MELLNKLAKAHISFKAGILLTLSFILGIWVFALINHLVPSTSWANIPTIVMGILFEIAFAVGAIICFVYFVTEVDSDEKWGNTTE